MKRTTLSIVLAASIGLGLAACKSTDTMDSTSGSSTMGSTRSGTGAMTERGNPSTGVTGSTPTTSSTGTTSGAGTWGSGTAGAAGTTGTTGTSTTTGTTSGTGR